MKIINKDFQQWNGFLQEVMSVLSLATSRSQDLGVQPSDHPKKQTRLLSRLDTPWLPIKIRTKCRCFPVWSPGPHPCRAAPSAFSSFQVFVHLLIYSMAILSGWLCTRTAVNETDRNLCFEVADILVGKRKTKNNVNEQLDEVSSS